MTIELDEKGLEAAICVYYEDNNNSLAGCIKAYLQAVKPDVEKVAIHPADLMMQYFIATGVPEADMDLENIQHFRDYCDAIQGKN